MCVRLPPAEKLERKTVFSRAATFHSMFTDVKARQTDRAGETEEIKKQALVLAGSQENPLPFLGQEYSQSGPLLRLTPRRATAAPEGVKEQRV